MLQRQKDESVLRDAFVLCVVKGCELHVPLLYTREYSSMSFAVVQPTLQGQFLVTPRDNLSNVCFADGKFTPPVSLRCTRFYEEFRIAARIRRLNEEVGIAPSWESVSGDINPGEKCGAEHLPRSSTGREKHNKRWTRWRRKWAARISRVMTQMGGSVERATLKVASVFDRETRFCHCSWATKVARNLGPNRVPLLLCAK